MSRRLAPPCAAVLLVVGVLAGTPALATQTRLFTPTPLDLHRGDSDGIAITSRGHLFPAPALVRLGESSPGAPSHVWASASDAAGNLYLGTGPDGEILRITPSGKESVFFRADEPMVTALAFGPSGELFAGTAPEGRIYRIAPDGNGVVWAETEERYVWSLAVAGDGRVFAGTGEHGVVYRIGRSGRPETIVDTDETHVVSLLLLPDGQVVAGGAGRGLIYRIGADGETTVVHDDDLPEVKAVVVEPDGDLIAALIAPPSPERRPPAVRIQLAGGNQVGAAPGEIESRQQPMLEGVIEGLPQGPDDGRDRRLGRGRVIRIAPDGIVTELWRSYAEAPFCLALDPEGRAVFGTGEPARLYRVESRDEDEVALLATLREAQITGIVLHEDDLLVATSNPASAYRIRTRGSTPGTFVSRPIDAGGVASWGTFRFGVEGSPGRITFQTRSGNSEDPDETWSDWSDGIADPGGSPIASPDARFLQWKVTLAGGDERARITDATVTFAPRNRPPHVREFRLEGDVRAVSGEAGFRFKGVDPDGDPLVMQIEYRGTDGSSWKTAARVEGPERSDEGGENPWNDGEVSWDTASVEEGRYRVRGVLSDAPGNPAGSGREDIANLVGDLLVDRSPPVVDFRSLPGGALEVTVTDAISSVARLDVVIDGQTRYSLRPQDGVCDSGRESFRLEADADVAGETRILRAVDAAGNRTEVPIPEG